MQTGTCQPQQQRPSLGGSVACVPPACLPLSSVPTGVWVSRAGTHPLLPGLAVGSLPLCRRPSPASRRPRSCPCLGVLDGGRLPRGCRSTAISSSCEEQSRLVRSGSCFPGERESRLWPPAGQRRQPCVPLHLGLPCGPAAHPSAVRADYQGTHTQGPPQTSSLTPPGLPAHSQVTPHPGLRICRGPGGS